MTTDKKKIDTTNKFLVASGGGIRMLSPPVRPMSESDAVMLAAYLVAMAEHKSSFTFQEALDAVMDL